MPSPPPCCCFCWYRFWDEAFERGRSRGLCSPRTPGTRVIDPGPISRSVYRIAQTMSACCLWNERSRGLLGRVIDPAPFLRSVYRITQAMSACCLGNDGGLCSPQTPAAGGFPLHPSCEAENGSFRTSFRMLVGERRKMRIRQEGPRAL